MGMLKAASVDACALDILGLGLLIIVDIAEFLTSVLKQSQCYEINSWNVPYVWISSLLQLVLLGNLNIKW